MRSNQTTCDPCILPHKLLEIGADPDAPATLPSRPTALHLAADWMWVEVLKKLLNPSIPRKVDVN